MAIKLTSRSLRGFREAKLGLIVVKPFLDSKALFGAILSTHGPTLLCSGRRWRGPGAGRDLLASWRTSARAGRWRSPTAPLKAGVGHSAALPRHPWRSVACRTPDREHRNRGTKGYSIPHQEGERTTEVERRYERIQHTPSGKRTNNRGGT